MTAVNTSIKNGISLRQASSGENSTSSVNVLASFTAATAIFKTSAGVFNLNLHLALHCGQATDFRLGAPAKGLHYLIAGAVTNSASHSVVIRPAGNERAKSIPTQC